MSYSTVELTKLNAINICLNSVGEPSVNALDDAGVDANIAADLIDEVSRSVQVRGWHWNTEYHTLSPDTLGFMYLPANVGKIDSVGDSRGLDVIQRGLRLYDKTNNTYKFEHPVELVIVVILAFEELPLSCRTYIAYQAAQMFQARMLGSDSIDAKLKEIAERAYSELMRDDLETSDPNMLNDSWTVMSILRR